MRNQSKISPPAKAKAPAGKTKAKAAPDPVIPAPKAKRSYGFRSDDSHPRNGGRPAGAKSVLSEAKLKWLSLSGQSPLEFLTAVFRNQLYSDYEVEIVDAAKGLSRVYPKLNPVTGALDCVHLPIELDKRIAAATAAAPYVHRKRPIGIDGGEGKPLTFVSADQLAKLSDKELGQLLEIMGRLGIGAEFEGGAQTPPDLED